MYGYGILEILTLSLLVWLKPATMLETLDLLSISAVHQPFYILICI